MKKILIVSHAMEIGGAERALIGLLEAIDLRKYAVDLFLLRHSGELMKYIPKQINLLPEFPQYAALAVPLATVLKKGQFRVALGRVIGKHQGKKRIRALHLPEDNGVQLEYSHKYTVNAMPEIQPETEYDLAISFLTPHYFTAKKVKAKKKIAWIHTDYSTTKVDVTSELHMWAAFDHIISISDSVTESFLNSFPSLQSKIVMIENIMPTAYMRELTNAFSVEKEMPSKGVKLLTIGRFSYQKKMEEIPEICRRIREVGIDAKWYLIGFGAEESLIRQRISQANAEDFVIILGKKENPYPYIKACDIYLQPSRYEGKSVAVREAQILNKPVIITDFATANSQLKDGYDGVIVPMDIEGSAKGIAAVIRDKELRDRLIENTRNNDYTNSGEISKLYNLVDLENTTCKS